MTPKILDAMRERWNTDPEFKEISIRNKKNASSNQDGRVNRGGVISIDERMRRCAKELGREVSIPEIFEMMNYDKVNEK